MFSGNRSRAIDTIMNSESSDADEGVRADDRCGRGGIYSRDKEYASAAF